MNIRSFCDDVLADRDCVALAALIRSGEINSHEVVEAAIKRAQAVNPRLNAISVEDFSNSLASAAKHEVKSHASIFSGLPTFIKDNEQVRGLPTRLGSRATSDAFATQSSKFIEEYLALGLINLGKTTMPEFGLTATTESLLHGATRNPWNSDYICGGSSGGAAALVAAGVVPIAHGNDGGGSIRIPAACCGLIGMKPTRDRLTPLQGTETLPINLVQQGVLTRSVRDTAAFFAAAERVYRNPSLPGIGDVTRPGKKRLRIGFFTEYPSHQTVHPENRDVTVKAAQLCASMGHRVEEIPTPIPASMEDDFKFYWEMIAFSMHHFSKATLGYSLDKAQLEPFTRGLSRLFFKRFYKLPYAIRRLKASARTLAATYERYDVVISPVHGHPTPKIGELSSYIDAESSLRKLSDFAPFTQEQNVTGAPAISLPMGSCSNGLPLGVQFAAGFGQDQQLLELALEIEEAVTWPRLA
jgi:amidase